MRASPPAGTDNHPAMLDRKLGSVGRPLDNLEVRICNEAGGEVAASQTGEIVVRGPSVTLGYLNEPEAGQRVFQDGWLHTGDLGRLDEDGYLWIEGRKAAFAEQASCRCHDRRPGRLPAFLLGCHRRILAVKVKCAIDFPTCGR